MAHIEKFKAPALGNMCAHYDRSAELERGVTRDNIDPERTHRNYNLRPNEEGVSQVQFINERIASLALKRAPRKDAVRMCDCLVTMPKGFDGDQREFFEAVCHTLDDLFGEGNCISAWVHLDEMTPHLHYAFVPVTEDGRLSAKDKLNRAFMQRFHARLEEGVSHLLGVNRVGLMLTEDERNERGGEYVGLEEYKEAKRQTEATQERLERLRREVEEVEPLAQGIAGSVETLRAARKDGSRERDLEEENRRLRERVSHLEGEAGRLERDVERLRVGVRGLRGRLEHLRERVTHAIERRSWVPEGVSQAAERIAAALGKRVMSETDARFEAAYRAARDAAEERKREMPARRAERRFKER